MSQRGSTSGVVKFFVAAILAGEVMPYKAVFPSGDSFGSNVFISICILICPFPKVGTALAGPWECSGAVGRSGWGPGELTALRPKSLLTFESP